MHKRKIRRVVRWKRSNCFFFAIWMFITRGGYIGLRRSRNIGGIHWLWSPDLKRWIHYTPITMKKNMFSAAMHKIWYKGRIQRGDSHPKNIY